MDSVISHNYKKLDVWNRSFNATLAVYRLTKSFPTSERYGLAAQMRRAAVSIPSNIAEGSVQLSGKGFRRYLRIALGSACELETQLALCSVLGLGSRSAAEHLLGEVDGIKRMLISLQQHVVDSR
jgi:four helix bundle protein